MMERHTPAIAILTTGLLLGIIGYIFFYNQPPGLNILLFALLVLATVIGWSVQKRTQLSLRRLWLIAPILFFAAMFAVRANPTILFLDGLMTVGLSLLLIHYLTRTEHVDEVSIEEQGVAGIHASIGLLFGTFPTIGGAWKEMQNVRDLGGMKSVLRGLLFALPVVIVFGILLSSADLVFAQRIEALFGFLLPENFENIVTMVLMTGTIAWLCTGLLYYALTSRQESPLVSSKSTSESPSDENETPEANEKRKSQKSTIIALNLTESGIILGSVVLLFAMFVVIQFTYLFGGRALIGETFTFSEYARRGFFELVAVSILTQGLILGLDQITVRRSTGQTLLFRILGILLTVETVVILASAWQRMSLYEVAFGFTHLRVYTHIFMVWLALLFVFGILSLFRVKKHIFSLGLLLIAIGYLGTLNILNVDNYIAARNIERFHQGYELDMCYLDDLSVDALATTIAFYDDTGKTISAYHLPDILRRWQRQTERRYVDGVSVVSFNYSYSRAQEALINRDFLVDDYTSSCTLQRTLSENRGG